MSSYPQGVDQFDLSHFSFDEPFDAGPGLPSNATVIVVEADSTVAGQLAAQLGSGVVTVRDLDELEHRLGLAPVVAVLGPSCADPAELAMVDLCVRRNPGLGTVLVTSQLSTELLQRALRAGVKDVLTHPVEGTELLAAVNRAAEAFPAMQPAAGEPVETFQEPGELGRVITVFSTKGGSGKSVVATNLAVTLARRSDRPVALVDAHLEFGDVAVMLKLSPRHTVQDAVEAADRLDPALLEAFLTVHQPSGLLVLPAPADPQLAGQIDARELVRVIEVLRSFCETVVIDTPASFNDVVLDVFNVSDDIIIVTGMDIPNIKNVKVGLHTLEQLGVPREKLHLVINRADSKVKLDVGEVEKTLRIRPIAHIPSDVVVPIAVNKGEPVVIGSPRSTVAKAIEGLAAVFTKQSSEAPAARRRFFG
jgi:pilus assembly protein CpaE